MLDDVVDVDSHLTGAIYKIPDALWGFSTIGRTDHPGVCVFSFSAKNRAVLCKGTDSGSRTAHTCEHPFIAVPDVENAFTKVTTFDLTPRYFRIRKIILIDHDRRMGNMSKVDLAIMQSEMIRIFASGCEREES